MLERLLERGPSGVARVVVLTTNVDPVAHFAELFEEERNGIYLDATPEVELSRFATLLTLPSIVRPAAFRRARRRSLVALPAAEVAGGARVGDQQPAVAGRAWGVEGPLELRHTSLARRTRPRDQQSCRRAVSAPVDQLHPPGEAGFGPTVAGRLRHPPERRGRGGINREGSLAWFTSKEKAAPATA